MPPADKGVGPHSPGADRQLTPHELPPIDAGRFLREQITRLAEEGDVPGEVKNLRLLRKCATLKPNEHRRLFQLMAVSGQSDLATRYVRSLGRAKPTKDTWSRVALVLWSTGHLLELFDWAGKHPDGESAAAIELARYGANSVTHREVDQGLAILRHVSLLRDASPEVLAKVRQALQASKPGLHESSSIDGTLGEPPPNDSTGPSNKRVEPQRLSAAAAGSDGLEQDGLVQAAQMLSKPDDRQQLIITLRTLQRLRPLKINETRRLFAALRAVGREGLIGRYIRRLNAGSPTKEIWARAALAFWTNQALVYLFDWCERHPKGIAGSFKALLSLADNSLEHSETAMAVAILDRLARWSQDHPEVALAAAELRLKAGDPSTALAEARRITPLPTEFLERAAQARLEQLATHLGVETAVDVVREYEELLQVLGPTPLLLRVERAAREWLGEGTGRRGRRASKSKRRRRGAELAASAQKPLLDDANRSKPGTLNLAVISQLAPSGEPYETATAPVNTEPVRPPGTRKFSLAGLSSTAPSEYQIVPPSGVSQALKQLEAAESPEQKLAAIEPLLAHAEDFSVRWEIQLSFAFVLNRIAGPERTAAAAELERAAVELAGRSDLLRGLLKRFYDDEGRPERALVLLKSMALQDQTAAEWFQAAQHAIFDQDLAFEFIGRAVLRGGLQIMVPAAAWLRECGHADQALTVWTLGPDATSYSARLGLLRTLHGVGRKRDVVGPGLTLLEAMTPFEPLSPDEKRILVSTVRLVANSAVEARDIKAIPPQAASFARKQPGDALAAWVDAMLHWGRQDVPRALASLNEAASQAPIFTGLAVDIPSEKALMHVRLQRYGDAEAALAAQVPASAVANAYYGKLLEPMLRVRAFNPGDFFPENLIDVILDEAARRPIGYSPRPRHVVTVSGSLAQGGSERQAVNIIKGLGAAVAVSGQSVFVRSVAGSNGFFLEEVSSLPAELVVYGENWRDPRPLQMHLPELGDRPRLSTAIELLPAGMREELVRLVRLFLDHRPQVVHLRQDLITAAIAAALAGVPKFFVHRGSLARNTWAHTPIQAATTLRPMRHAYRRLLEMTSFFLVNNSEQGRRSDIDWIAWPDENRFRVVHNAVDFESLGADLGRNHSLRDALGVGPSAPLIGGVFRVVSVKRPALWIETAHHFLKIRPDAHFVIAGDGNLAPEMRAYAQAHGFSDRLHMPGSVDDVSAWYRAMDALLLTSEREGLPNVLIEAQHFGVPVVSADVGGAIETFKDRVTGQLVHRDADASVYAESLQSILEHARRNQAAPFVHGRFAPEQAIGKVLEIYGFHLDKESDDV